MATKKSSKTNKTAHVLNVLAGANQEELAEMTAAAESAPQKQASRPPVVEVANANDEALSQAILDTLTEDIEGTAKSAQPAPSEAPRMAEQVQASAPAGQAPESKLTTKGAKPVAEISMDSVAEEKAAEAEKVSTEVESTIAAALAKPVQTSEMPVLLKMEPNEHIGYVNIMQALVEERAPKYLKMFHVCPCARCTADVKALALTNLPSKYAVMEKSDVIPMLTVYEGRYSQVMTAQLIKACELVSKSPRHK